MQRPVSHGAEGPQCRSSVCLELECTTLPAHGCILVHFLEVPMWSPTHKLSEPLRFLWRLLYIVMTH